MSSYFQTTQPFSRTYKIGKPKGGGDGQGAEGKQGSDGAGRPRVRIITHNNDHEPRVVQHEQAPASSPAPAPVSY
ncbi:Os11g0699532 [Oryza sativa Japonica Group]|uniref:Os11g0699532 protein n=2 Tax=Oryza TaxID=4527 RepID=A0A0P0Y5M8_ORYSJ|nr:Os11g0699532 [Oryza sativa Japonica Group]BBF90209.1 retrotransposon -like [Oryza rufipogon]